MLSYYRAEDLMTLEEEGDIDAGDAGIMMGFISAET